MGNKNRLPYVDIMTVQHEVTGSCNLVIVKYPDETTTRFIVDCGMFQEREYAEDNKTFPFKPENINFAIVTHNHVDHTGRLPLLTKQGFNGNIYASKPTTILLPLALEDSYKVVKDIAKRNNEPQLYTDLDVSNTLSKVKALKFEQTQEINPNIRVTMFKNGHLLGAAIVLVQISCFEKEDINLLFTGDYNNKNVFFDVPDLPDWVLELPLTIVQESTYGTSDSKKDVTECFEKKILECVERNSTAVNMVFSLGRMQEILYRLKCMQKEGKISSSIPIFADGKLGIRYTNIYLKNDEMGIKEDMKDFLPENLTFVDKDTREEVMMSDESKIVVTTSGMGTYGPAPMYILNYIKDKDCLIQFNGYVAEDTMGRKIKNAEQGEIVSVAGVFVEKRSHVEYTTEFSAHAKADEMIMFLKKFKNIKLLLVNHGARDVKEAFAKRIIKEVKPKHVGILDERYLFRINAYGLMKTMSTKFQ